MTHAYYEFSFLSLIRGLKATIFSEKYKWCMILIDTSIFKPIGFRSISNYPTTTTTAKKNIHKNFLLLKFAFYRKRLCHYKTFPFILSFIHFILIKSMD